MWEDGHSGELPLHGAGENETLTEQLLRGNEGNRGFGSAAYLSAGFLSDSYVSSKRYVT